jgi:hypothetical protein
MRKFHDHNQGCNNCKWHELMEEEGSDGFAVCVLSDGEFNGVSKKPCPDYKPKIDPRMPKKSLTEEVDKGEKKIKPP